MQNGEGKAGLEKLYDEQLSGTNGLEIYIEDSNGQKKQSQTDTKGTEIGWFVTIMPATNNKEALELVSMTENVKKRGGSGYVVNKTKKIMEEYLQ